MSTATQTLTPAQRILTEDVLSFSDARDEVGRITGHRPDKSTMIRWVHRGVGQPKTKLEAIKLGNALFTSRQALTRFIEARSASIGQ